MSIRIQTADFDLGTEYQLLRDKAYQIGAIVTFCGLVRDFDEGDGQFLELEYYPGMTEQSLKQIIDQAKERWQIINAHIIHRVGKLTLGEQIVFVGVNSPHRDAAFLASQFIMDHLKTQAPFWKRAISKNQTYWVEAKAKDQEAKKLWE